MTWQEEIIEAWGISAEAIEFAQLKLSKDKHYVEYPLEYPPTVEGKETVIGKIYRKRIMPSYHAENPSLPKTLSPSEDENPYEHLPLFYTANYKDCAAAIKQSGGKVIIMEGDKDYWTALTVGWQNVVALISANGSVNPELIYQLKQMGAKQIVSLLDADIAGLQTVISLKDATQKTGVQFTAYQIPPFLKGQKTKDYNDVFQVFNRDKAEFLDYLDTLRVISLPNANQREYARNNDYFDESLYLEIEQALGVEDFGRDGYSKTASVCPFHNHENDGHMPAFYWNKNSRTGYCFKRGEAFLAKEVADALGINWKEKVNRQSKDKDIPSIEVLAKKEDNPVLQKEKQSSSQLVVASNILSRINTNGGNWSNVPTSELLYDLDDAFDNYIQRLDGTVTSAFPPIENPIPEIHYLDGFARFLTRPLMVGLLGLSGGYKTSFFTRIVNKMSLAGEHGIVWSPEWSPEKNADRFVQQYSGLKMQEVSMLERHYWEEEVKSPSRHGIKPDDNRIMRSKNIAANLKKDFKGKVFYLRQFGSNILDILEMVVEAAKRMTEMGCPPSYFIFDYAQMALAPQGWGGGGWDMNQTITYTKGVTMQLGLVTFMASQVRKEDAEGVIDKGVLTSTSGVGFRDDQFNLFMTLTPKRVRITTQDGRILQRLLLAVTKNSTGQKADTEEDAIDLYVDLNKMTIVNAKGQ